MTQPPKISIPDDWDGEGWECFPVFWPKSQQWIGILMGFLSLAAYGRTWDRKSGTITDAQKIGLEIIKRTFPLVSCNHDSTDSGEVTKYIYIEVESQNMTTMCTLNKHAIEIRNGNELWVNDHCEGWVQVGTFDSVAIGQPDASTPPIENPPPALQSGTSCAKAQRMATMTYNVVQAGFNACEIDADFLWGWYEFADEIRKQFNGINFGDSELYNMFYSCYATEVAGLESETEDVTLIDYLACAWSPILDSGPEGISSDQYQAMKTLLTTVMKSRIGDSSYEGFGATMRNVWERAFASFGAGDVKKLTTNLVPTGLEDCTCPDAPIVYDWDYTYDLTASPYEFVHAGIQGEWVSGSGYGSDSSAQLDLRHNNFSDNVQSFFQVCEVTINIPGTQAFSDGEGMLMYQDGFPVLLRAGADFDQGSATYVANTGLPLSLNTDNGSWRLALDFGNATGQWFVTSIRMAGSGVAPIAPPA